MHFYLGTHVERWLSTVDVPLFVSRRRLCRRKSLPRALAGWALDSGGFSELSLFGEWTITTKQYAAEVRRYADEIGRLEWAASMDYMCEPWIVSKTGLSVQEHQHRTVANYLTLRETAPDLPFVPVLQGWQVRDYIEHIEMYAHAGIDLYALPRVGLGSVCRRQHTDVLDELIQMLQPMRLHGFGVKAQGLGKVAGLLTSADSMAWSFAARRQEPLAGCTHRNCANCVRFALRWRGALLERSNERRARPIQARFAVA